MVDCFFFSFEHGSEGGIILQFEQRIRSGFRQTLDVDTPTGELGSQAGILTVTADGQAELIFRNNDSGGFAAAGFLLIQVNTADTCRADGFGNKERRDQDSIR